MQTEADIENDNQGHFKNMLGLQYLHVQHLPSFFVEDVYFHLARRV